MLLFFSILLFLTEKLDTIKVFYEVDKIKVFDVPEDLTTEALELYFEDSFLSNGGPTKFTKRIPEKRQAIIQYNESKGTTFSFFHLFHFVIKLQMLLRLEHWIFISVIIIILCVNSL